MYIDISIQENSTNLILHLDHNERYLPIQDNCPDYHLCHVKSGDKHYIPYIALPLIRDVCKKLKYSLSFSDKLKQYHREQTQFRENLELLRRGESVENWPELPSIRSAIESFEREMKITLLEGQKRSIPYCLFGKRILIGNEIGTGKSLLANFVGKYLIKQGKVKKILILVPASLVKNYQDDYHKFFGTSGLLTIGSEPPAKRKLLYHQFMSSSCNFLLTNFEKCLHDYDYLKQCRFQMLVVDEFHKMRNFLTAKRSINFFDMLENIWKPEYRFPMSGTPIENKLFDLFPIIKLLDGGKILGGQRFFENNFIKYEDKFFKIKYKGQLITKQQTEAVGFKNIEWVKKLIKPIIIREKLKLNVKYFHEFVLMDLPKDMKTKYGDIRKEFEAGPKRYHALRQFLCDCRRGNFTSDPKTEMLEDVIDQTSEKIVVFSYYICSMEYLSEFLKSKGIRYYEISGRTSEIASETVKKFSDDSEAKVLICTDKVNFGCNCQAAKLTINWDIPLKPTISDQRKGRLYRTGQTQDVYGKTFIYRDTVEEIIYSVFLKKQDMITTTIETLHNDDIAKLEADIEKEVMANI